MGDANKFFRTIAEYLKLFAFGFAAGCISWIVSKLVFDKLKNNFYTSSDLYITGLTVGMFVIATNIANDLILCISFMKDFKSNLEPVFQALVGVIALTLTLGVVTPVSNYLNLKKFTKFTGLWIGFEHTFKNNVAFIMIRYTMDSLIVMAQKKLFGSMNNKNVQILISFLCAAISAAVTPFICHPINKQIRKIQLMRTTKSQAIHDALFIIPINIFLNINEQYLK